MGKRRRQQITGLTEKKRIHQAIKRKKKEEKERRRQLAEDMARAVSQMIGVPKGSPLMKMPIKSKNTPDTVKLPAMPTPEDLANKSALAFIEAKILKARREQEKEEE